MLALAQAAAFSTQPTLQLHGAIITFFNIHSSVGLHFESTAKQDHAASATAAASQTGQDTNLAQHAQQNCDMHRSTDGEHAAASNSRGGQTALIASLPFIRKQALSCKQAFG
jgi:hypothetical protein